MRWAYAAFVVFGLLYFPARVGFDLHPRACELAISGPLILISLANYAHIVLFSIFFVMSRAQFRGSGTAPYVWAGLATIIMGTLVEIAQGVTGNGHCRVRDLIPDGIGAAIGATIFALGTLVHHGALWRTCQTARRCR